MKVTIMDWPAFKPAVKLPETFETPPTRRR
jgi:hypothetical protein